MKWLSCLKMDYDVEEGLPKEFMDFAFYAQDALEFELQLSEAREVKFTETLTEPLSIGSHIVCTGTPDDDIPWFALNIGCGDPELPSSDVAVHFNVRMPQCYVVRNTKRHDKWGIEETTSFRPFPFEIGTPFTIEVVIDETESLWAVNGEHFCSYQHRNPSALAANWVQVVGVKDASIKIQKTDTYPTLAPVYPEVPVRGSLDATAQDEVTWVPHPIAVLPNGVPNGHQIVIHGRLRPMLHSFTIDLMDNTCEWPRPNIHIHVNLRAYDDAQKERQLVVLNAWFGAWGSERRQRSARLVPGTMTTFRIVRNAGEWAVFADDLLIGELEYRASAAGVKAIRVRGDFYPEQIYLCPSTSSPGSEQTSP